LISRIKQQKGPSGTAVREQQEESKQRRRVTLYDVLTASYLPYFLSAELFDETHQLHKLFVRQQCNASEVVRMTSSIWIKAFEKQIIMASDFSWRFSHWNALVTRKGQSVIQIHSEVQDNLTKNHPAMSRLFACSGALSSALDEYKRAAVSGIESCNLRVTVTNLAVIQDWLSRHLALFHF
jgi:hypothetical protein